MSHAIKPCCLESAKAAPKTKEFGLELKHILHAQQKLAAQKKAGSLAFGGYIEYTERKRSADSKRCLFAKKLNRKSHTRSRSGQDAPEN